MQAVDPRWGVRREEVKDEHAEVDLYLKELRRCQELSAGPDFAVSDPSLKGGA